MFHYLYKTHKGEVADMLHYMAAGCCHTVAAPAAYICRRILGTQRFDQVRPVKVTRCFAGYDVVFHVGKIAFYLPAQRNQVRTIPSMTGMAMIIVAMMTPRATLK